MWSAQAGRPRGPRPSGSNEHQLSDIPVTALRTAVGLSMEAARMPGALVRTVSKGLRNETSALSLYAPRTILNQPITGSRRFAAQSYSLPRLKKLAGAFNCTLNDVVLSMCGHALREYLISQNALPDQPLIAMVPMSLRKDDSAGGNGVVPYLPLPEIQKRVTRPNPAGNGRTQQGGTQ